jgi:hypothetical protein
MRQVYALLGLVKKWGPARVNDACAKAAQAEAYSVSLIGRMLERATESGVEQPPVQGTLLTGRFVRPPEDFRVSPAKPVDPRYRGPCRPGRRRHYSGWFAMTAPVPIVSTELKVVLRKVKLGRCLDTLPERLALAKSRNMGHAEFLELVLSDEVTRRETTSAALRARSAGLDPDMCLEHWDETTEATFDHQTWDELCSLRFIDADHNVIIMGPVGVGKTFMACALGHVAVRHRYTVTFCRTDADGFQIPADVTWSTGMGFWIDAAALLGVVDVAPYLRAQIIAYHDQIATVTTIFQPALSHYLGLLDHLVGQYDDAERWFSEALEIHERVRSPILIARTQAAWAALLADRAQGDDRPRARTMAQSALDAAAAGGCGYIEADARLVLERLS